VVNTAASTALNTAGDTAANTATNTGRTTLIKPNASATVTIAIVLPEPAGRSLEEISAAHEQPAATAEPVLAAD